MRIVTGAKKEFGQNFLVNEKTVERIIQYIKESKPSAVIEIGPGQGAFTKYFSTAPFKSIAVEIDKELIPGLEATLPNIKFVNDDFLEIDLQALFTEQGLDEQTVFYGSLPYNISKRIIRKVTKFNDFKKAYFIIQKEVAEKLQIEKPLARVDLQTLIATNSKKSKSSRLSNKLAVLTSNFATVKRLFDISPTQFRPIPKVMSSVIEITPHKPVLEPEKYNQFGQFTRSLFKQPRKTVYNNIRVLSKVQDFIKTNSLQTAANPAAPNTEADYSAENQFINTLLQSRPEKLTADEALFLFEIMV